MHRRFILIAVAAFASGSALAAEPSKAPAPAPETTQPHPNPPQVVLASADVHATAPADQQTPATPKRRVARVTSCRCGDQQAQPEE